MRLNRGKLLTCDPALKEYLVWLDKEKTPHFIIAELDSTHLFIVDTTGTIGEYLQTQLDAWHDANSYSDALQEEAESGGGMPTQPKSNAKH